MCSKANFELVLANALQIRSVPGRKTDVNDAMWIADLLAHGIDPEQLRPARAIDELRDLTRTQKQLVREVSQHTQRIQKVLEDAHLKPDQCHQQHHGQEWTRDDRGDFGESKIPSVSPTSVKDD